MSETPVQNTKSFSLFSDISENSGQNSVISKINGFCRILSYARFGQIHMSQSFPEMPDFRKSLRHIHSKNAFKTFLARSWAEKNSFLCFDHFLSFGPYDGRRVYDGRHMKFSDKQVHSVYYTGISEITENSGYFW